MDGAGNPRSDRCGNSEDRLVGTGLIVDGV